MVCLVYMISVTLIVVDLCESQFTEQTMKLPSECGVITSDDKITNGMNATLRQFPFMALLGYTQNVFQVNLVQFVCGGTVITEDYILTAAHCFNASLSFVRLGELDIRNDIDCVEIEGFSECGDPFVDIAIEKQIIHNNYNPRNFENDIALVKLSNKIKFTEFIQPICLPINIDLPLHNLTLTVSGWGTTAASTTIGSSILQYAQINIWQNTKCENVLPREVRPLKETQICGNGKEGEDACRGDSGGPLIIIQAIDFRPKYFQVGVVSFAAISGCGNQELPSVYTRIDKYLNWIIENI